MSSRLPPPVQADLKQRAYGAPITQSHALPATEFAMAGPRALPLPSFLAKPTSSLPSISSVQSPYKPPVLQTRAESSAFASQHSPLYPLMHPYTEPAQRRGDFQTHAAAPLDRLLHSRSDIVSGITRMPFYPSQHRINSPVEEISVQDHYDAPHRVSVQEEGKYHSNRISSGGYQPPRVTAGPHPGSAPSIGGFVAPLVHLPAPPARHRKPQDITDRYNLIIRQQPIAARACGFGERDRRVIDPPPIVQLSLTSFDPNSPLDISELRWPFNVVHCALLSVPTQSSVCFSQEDVTTVTDPNNAGRQSRRLMGTLVASPFVGTDPDAPPSRDANARLGCFFIFPDLSCRQNGLYRLRFTLMKVNVEVMPTGGRSSMVGAVESDVFEVFSAKDFPGMRASTALTRELKRQGATVSVKKGNEAKTEKKGKKRGSTISERSGSEGSDSGTASKSSSKKKLKD